jgi:ubiquitin-protein ligase
MGDNAYPTDMPTIEVQEEILRTLRDATTAISLSDLVQKTRLSTSQPSITIRAAVLPLISRRRVELTVERKLQIAK